MSSKISQKTVVPVKVFTAPIVGRLMEMSEGWGRIAFAKGHIPTEILVNGKHPAVSETTFNHIKSQLLARRK